MDKAIDSEENQDVEETSTDVKEIEENDLETNNTAENPDSDNEEE